ncbi:MAG: GNAT family N-acetyltransferase [Usitatibacter sp.]
MTPKLRVRPVTADRWDDFARLFGPRGACGGCWCMTPRLSRADYQKLKGAGNRRRMRARIAGGRVPGVLGYVGAEPVAWCSIEPRQEMVILRRSRLFQPVDDRPVWSICCLYVAPAWRHRGLSAVIIGAAAEWARGRGAQIVEAYPVEPKQNEMPPVFAYMGVASAFRAAGFSEVARRSETRPLMRKQLSAL